MTSFELDINKLEFYLSQHIPGFKGPISAEKFAGGQSNPTYRLSAKSGRYVLRRKPPGKLLSSAHAVEREYRVMAALANSTVPVPTMRVLCEDEQIIGSAFYVMDFLDGRVFWDPALPSQTTAERAAIYDAMSRLLANLHTVQVDRVGLSNFGKPGNYFKRQLSRWTRQYRASQTENIPAMEALIPWLETNLPVDDGQVCISHGDFRLDNIMFHKESTTVIALLDWELSTLGHPYADLAYQCMQLRLSNQSNSPGLGDIDRSLLGIPNEQEYIAKYCRYRGIDGIENWNYYLVFSFFRLAAILQGVYKRALDGNASSAKGIEYGAMITPLSEHGINLADA